MTPQQQAAIRNATERLSHARCADDHHMIVDGCPFCADIAAYFGLLTAFPKLTSGDPA